MDRGSCYWRSFGGRVAIDAVLLDLTGAPAAAGETPLAAGAAASRRSGGHGLVDEDGDAVAHGA
jgi:hypothetical protein